jgi:hypothetical protein
MLDNADCKHTDLEQFGEWREFFSRYSDIVLVANSDEVKIDALVARNSSNTLFVFFNKVYKVLNKPFVGNSILLTRSGARGANLVTSGKVSKVLQYFDDSGFMGVVNLRIGDGEVFSPSSAFPDVKVRHLDLTNVFARFYPSNSLPTSGFALCFWLTTLQLDAKITLAGFSSKRSERYQVFECHDWTFEQVLLRLMYRNGKIEFLGRDDTNPYAELSAHFPEYAATEIALTANEVLSERLVNLSSIVDRLMHVTKFLRFVDRTYKRLKHRTPRQTAPVGQKRSTPAAKEIY